MPVLALPPDFFIAAWHDILWRKGMVLVGVPLSSKIGIQDCQIVVFANLLPSTIGTSRTVVCA